jgi:hypothetical protein
MPSPRKTGFAALLLSLAALVAVAPVQGVPPDKYIPADSEGVAVINISELLASPLLKKLGVPEHLKAALDSNEEAKTAFSSLGIDPFKDLDSVLITGPGGKGGPEKVLAVVRGKFDPAKVAAAAKDYAKKNPDALKIETKGDTTVYVMTDPKKKNDKPGYLVVADKSTLVTSMSEDVAVEAATKEKTEKLNADLTAALKKVSGKEGMWIAGVFNSDLRKQIAANKQFAAFSKIANVVGTFNLTEDFAMKFLLQADDAESVGKLQTAVSTNIKGLSFLASLAGNEKVAEAVAKIVDKFKVAKEDTTVSVSLNLTQKEIEDLVELAKSMQK